MPDISLSYLVMGAGLGILLAAALTCAGARRRNAILRTRVRIRIARFLDHIKGPR